LTVSQGGDAQRNMINQEIDHLKELVEVKRQQLLSKSDHEGEKKRAQVQSQMDSTASARDKALRLVSRSRKVQSLRSEHAFLALVLPLIQDMKKCSDHQFEVLHSVGSFRPLSIDAQVLSFGDLDLGFPKPQSQSCSNEQSAGQGQFALEPQQQRFVASSGYSMPHAGSALVPFAASPQPPLIQSRIPVLSCSSQ